MRITNYVDFYHKDRVYNPDTSKYDVTNKLVGRIPCNVTSLGVERSIQLFGKYDISNMTVRPFEELNFNWSYLIIDGVEYVKKSSLSPLNIKALVVGAKSE